MGHHGPAVRAVAGAGGRVDVAGVDQDITRTLSAHHAGSAVQLLARHPNFSDVPLERPELHEDGWVDVAGRTRFAPLITANEIAHPASVD